MVTAHKPLSERIEKLRIQSPEWGALLRAIERRAPREELLMLAAAAWPEQVIPIENRVSELQGIYQRSRGATDLAKDLSNRKKAMEDVTAQLDRVVKKLEGEILSPRKEDALAVQRARLRQRRQECMIAYFHAETAAASIRAAREWGFKS